ncbi:mycofactocin biosynthesis peptidyl-dipeptidase MftE [Nocardia camponoti]|uniref:Mycofactocin system creatininase family protein n=1 Tax=Nocardia camponoti TaxID=1616106 RepID=A0A917V4U6_9NOCA|nr:mycofactocin biosynthesis peptidyl-dipeptidase MftE [Nocardia camponoti]GGK37884.1 mycofactocin system creatininase family protein [Nocardia camponoti]
MEVAQLTSPAVAALNSGVILAIPLGATEQHGPHLPLSTDLDIAVALCARLAAARGDVVVAPGVPYGASGEHAGFAGTLSIGQSALELLVVELCRSATASFSRIVLVNAHGGNVEALRRAVALLRSESRDVQMVWPDFGAGDAHAGRTETSIQLQLNGLRVRLGEAAPGNTRPLAELLPELRASGVAGVSANGVLGDPTGATAAEGARLLDHAVTALLTTLGRWWPLVEEGPQG